MLLLFLLLLDTSWCCPDAADLTAVDVATDPVAVPIATVNVTAI